MEAHPLSQPRIFALPLTLLVAVALLAVPAGMFLQDAADGAIDGEVGALAPTAPTFAAPTLVVATDGYEPSVRVAPDNTVYVSFARYALNPSWTFFKRGGALGTEQWTKLSNPFPAVLGAEPEIEVTPEGRLYFTDLSIANVVVAWYDNQQLVGRTPVGEASAVVDRQWLAIGAPGPLGGHEAWITTNDIERGLNMYYSPDITAIPAAKIQSIQTLPHRGDPPTYDPVHKWVYVAYDVFSGAENGIMIARSNALQPLPSKFIVDSDIGVISLFPSVATDAAGNVWVTWASWENNEWATYVTWSTNQGFNWAPAVKVSGVGTSTFPWIAGGSAGKAAVAFLKSDTVGDLEDMPATAEWKVHVALLDITSGSLQFTSAPATPVVHTGSICISGTNCDLGAPNVDRDLGDYLQIDIGPDGMAHVAYTADHPVDAPRIYHVRQTGGSPS